MANTPWVPPPIVEQVERRFAACEPVYRDLLTVLAVHGHNDPTLKVEVAIVALVDAAFDLASASGLLWSADFDLVAALRIEADRWEQRRQSEPAPPVIETLRDVLRTARTPKPNEPMQ
jgi:hypothetical protein